MNTAWSCFYCLSAAVYIFWSALAGAAPEFPAVVVKAGAGLSLLLAAIRSFARLRSRGHSDKALGLVIAGLPFCIAGDVFLGIPGDAWFVPGLAAFLAGYALFAVSLVTRLPIPRYGLMLLPALIPGAFFLAWFTLPPDLVWPVRIFVAVQTAFLAAGLAMLWRRTPGSFSLGTGAALLYLSDAVIGAGRFTPVLPAGAVFEVLVLLPYFAGLYLIVSGSIRLARTHVGD